MINFTVSYNRLELLNSDWIPAVNEIHGMQKYHIEPQSGDRL